MLASLDDYHHAKNLSDRLVPSRDINDQRIRQFDWTRGTTSHTQPKVVVTDSTFP